MALLTAFSGSSPVGLVFIFSLGFIFFGGVGVFQKNWEAQVLGVTIDQAGDVALLGVFARVFFQMQQDFGAALGFALRLDGEGAVADARPVHASVGLSVSAAREDFDFVGDHERRVKADAELADDVGLVAAAVVELRQEFGAAGFGDGAEVGYYFLFAHADAVIADRYGLGFAIDADADRQLAILRQQLVVADGLVAQFVERVGGVGD